MPSAHVITRAEMARRLGVSRAAVTRACREGGRLEPACSGKGVNVLHEAACRWLAQRAATAGDDDAPIPVDDAEPPPGERPSVAELELALGPRQLGDLDELGKILTRLTEDFGEAPAVERWVRCRKWLEEARKAEMLRARVEGRLVARTSVVRMIDHVDVAFRLLLADAPRTIATRLGVPDMPAATAMIRDVMGQLLTAARDQMAGSLEADDPMAPLLEAAE